MALPVIMVSAKSQVESVVEGLEAGCNDYVSKVGGLNPPKLPTTKNDTVERVFLDLAFAGNRHACSDFRRRETEVCGWSAAF